MQQQPDDPGVILAYDDDDPPPLVTYSDMHWWIANRVAEESMRFMRLVGLL